MGLSSLKFEVKIIEARNVKLKSPDEVIFVRFYLYAGNNSKVKVNTKEMSLESESDQLIVWNQSFCLECQGDEAVVQELKQKSVVFELRRRKTTSFLSKWSRSELVGRGEVDLKSVFESKGMEIKKSVVINEKIKDSKASLLKIGLKVEALEMVRKEKKVESDLCECRDCDQRCNCVDYEAFALVCVLDGIYFVKN